jgi:hypothetical protein
MELQFNGNWGPLSGIGLLFLDLKSAVELAVEHMDGGKHANGQGRLNKFLALRVASSRFAVPLTSLDTFHGAYSLFRN